MMENVPKINDLCDEAEAQLALMQQNITMLRERGYWIRVHMLNRTGMYPSTLMSSLGGGFEGYINTVSRRMKLRPLCINIIPLKQDIENIKIGNTTLSATNFVVRFDLDNVKGMLPIRAAMDYMSTEVEHLDKVHHHGSTLMHQVTVNEVRYRAIGKEGLSAVLAVLDMPQHRSILTNIVRRGTYKNG